MSISDTCVSGVSSVRILLSDAQKLFNANPKAVKVIASVCCSAVTISMISSFIKARRAKATDGAEGNEAFRPLTAGERFDAVMRRAEVKFLDLKENVSAMSVERGQLFSTMKDDMEEARAVWRKNSCKRHVLYDELITKLLIEADGIVIPTEMVAEAVEEAQSSILSSSSDPRQRRKDLIKRLHDLSNDLNALQH